MKNRHDYHDPDDDSCPKAASMERLIDHADFLRDERRDREMEEREAARESSGAGAGSALELIDQLSRHIAQMAPHQMERQAGQLVIAARNKIRELWQIIEDDCESDTDARTEAAKHLGEWVWGDSHGIPSMQEVIERMASQPNAKALPLAGPTTENHV